MDEAVAELLIDQKQTIKSVVIGFQFPFEEQVELSYLRVQSRGGRGGGGGVRTPPPDGYATLRSWSGGGAKT